MCPANGPASTSVSPVVVCQFAYPLRRVKGRPIHQTHGFGQVCGSLTRRPVHCIRLRRRKRRQGRPTFTGHTDQICRVLFSPNGLHLVTERTNQRRSVTPQLTSAFFTWFLFLSLRRKRHYTRYILAIVAARLLGRVSTDRSSSFCGAADGDPSPYSVCTVGKIPFSRLWPRVKTETGPSTDMWAIVAHQGTKPFWPVIDSDLFPGAPSSSKCTVESPKPRQVTTTSDCIRSPVTPVNRTGCNIHVQHLVADDRGALP
ncbi:hypothetical protein EDB85DRAFT_996772 [Lactarius pseudohatsudake]|nr:hypothetical protein EDB85DRAFT_996772 [Lactarius pseudohatsudake]